MMSAILWFCAGCGPDGEQQTDGDEPDEPRPGYFTSIKKRRGEKSPKTQNLRFGRQRPHTSAAVRSVSGSVPLLRSVRSDARARMQGGCAEERARRLSDCSEIVCGDDDSLRQVPGGPGPCQEEHFCLRYSHEVDLISEGPRVAELVKLDFRTSSSDPD